MVNLLRRSNLVLILALVLAGCVKPTMTPTVTPTPTPFISPLAPVAKTPTPTIVPTPQGNLSNGSFEEPYEHYGDAFDIAEGWRGWFVNPPPCDPDAEGCFISCPWDCQKADAEGHPTGECKADIGCYWAQPEFARSWGYWNRILSGYSSQKIFWYGRQGEGGLYRRVVAQQGRMYRFTISMQAWMCYNFDNCAGGLVSDMPTTMHLRIGIDPLGSTDPFTSSIVWSAEHDSFDTWSVYSVTARAMTGHVTVFTYARPDWGKDTHLRIDNDVYIDNADLLPLDYLPLDVLLPVVMR